jgi:hypothetical protein
MAITGKFLADFTSFYTAVQKAEVELRGLETGAGRVEKSLNRMVDDFGGRKLIQEATLIAEAVNRIGGASTLTEREQRRVNAAVTEAIAKYKALGQEAPKHLHDLAAATAQVATSTEKIPAPAAAAGTSFKSLFGAFTAANLAGQAISFLTSEVTELATKGLKFPALEASFERLAQGVGQNSTDMLESLQTATKGMVSEFDLMQGANKALLLGLPVTKESMGEMAKAATALGRAMGQDATKSLDDLITALGRSSPMILDNLGLSVKLGDANEAMAQKLGKTVDALTDAEKKMAFYEAAMEAARKKTQELGEQSLTLSEMVSRAWTSIGDVITRRAGDANVGIGRLLSSWETFRRAMEDSGGSLFGAVDAAAAQEKFEQLDRTLKQSILAKPPAGFGQFKGLGLTVKSFEEMNELGKELDATLKKDAQAFREAARKAEEHWREVERNSKEIVRLTRESDAAKRSLDAMFRDVIQRGAAGEFSRSMEKNRAVLHDTVDEAITFINVWKNPGGTTGIKNIEKALDEMSQTGIKGQDQLAEAAERARAQFEHELQTIHELANLFGRIGGALGGGFGQTLQDIGGVINQVGQAKRAFGDLATTGGGLVATASALAAGGLAVYGAWRTVIAITEKLEFNAGQQQEQFLRAAGALRDFNLEARTAGVDLQHLFNIKDQESFQAAFAKAQTQIEKNNKAMLAYGLTWRDFSTMTQEFVTQTGRDLIDQFDHFMRLGGDTEKVLKGMSGAFSQLIKDAVQTGSKIPSAMRPMIEQLIRTKKLTEDAAAALLGMSKEATPAFADIKAAAERYGLQLDALGPKIEQIRITEVAEAIARDFKLFEDAGADMNAVLIGMQDEVQELVTNALKMGLELPAGMRPIIEAMIRMGLLTDENGNKLTDLGKLTFAESLVDKIDELIEALLRLIDETDNYGNEAEKAFGRARNAAEILGRAIPRGFVPPGVPSPPGGGRTNPDGTPDNPAPVDGPPHDPNAPLPDPNDPSNRRPHATPTIIVQTFLDGRMVAESMAPHLPGVVESLGAYTT